MNVARDNFEPRVMRVTDDLRERKVLTCICFRLIYGGWGTQRTLISGMVLYFCQLRCHRPCGQDGLCRFV